MKRKGYKWFEITYMNLAYPYFSFLANSRLIAYFYVISLYTSLKSPLEGKYFSHYHKGSLRNIRNRIFRRTMWKNAIGHSISHINLNSNYKQDRDEFPCLKA